MFKNPRDKFFGHFNNRNNDYPEFPMPVDSGKWDGQNAFIAKLSKVETDIRHHKFGGMKGCKGSSSCRFCGKSNGNYEYEVYLKKPSRKVVWPQGYMHYIEDHNVKPEQEFIDLIESLAD